MAEFVNFASGTITDSPLTVGATSVNSAAFATVLPEIAAPHTMSIVVDPDGDDGIPETMLVTVHGVGTTVATVTRGQQTSTGGSVARAHAAGTPWVLGITALDANRMTGDPGDMKAGIWSSPPDGWLLMGQLITAADVTYPNLWAVAPASWKTGTSLNLPSMDGRTFLGGGTLGASGGANTHTLATGNLPAHTHAINHNHASGLTGPGNLATHTHDIDHNHPSATTSSSTVAATVEIDGQSSPTSFGIGRFARSNNAGTQSDFTTTTTGGAHTHTLDLPVTSGLTSGNAGSMAHEHSVDLPVFVGPSGSFGSGIAVDHTPSHLCINVAIKW